MNNLNTTAGYTGKPKVVYIITCTCGRELRSLSETVICPRCGVQITMEWPASHKAKPREKRKTPLLNPSDAEERGLVQ